jgi:hypothetical protein
VATDAPVTMAAGLLSAVLSAVIFIGILWNVGGDLVISFSHLDRAQISCDRGRSLFGVSDARHDNHRPPLDPSDRRKERSGSPVPIDWLPSARARETDDIDAGRSPAAPLAEWGA